MTSGAKGRSGVSDDESEIFPRPFGPYLLLDNFARGGMGEVYLAKLGGIAGLERYCVLKKLRAELTQDREYVARFIDEARVVVTLDHTNICHVFDVGRVKDEYYLAMEYVSGRDGRTLQDRCRQRGKVIPPAVVLHLVCETLEALDYAHRRVHPVTREALHLVHRDVSPQNVLISFEGEVKLIDFGLAASKLKMERTQPNVVMGKMAYMAPEQARGDAIDHRADLFACGVLCYELLAGERFYETMSANDIWAVAGRGGYVPRRWEAIDRDVAAILARALHPDPLKRYETCGEFRDALIGHLHARYPGSGVRGLRELMAEVFADELEKERAMLARLGTVTVASFQEDLEHTKSQSVTLVRADAVAKAQTTRGAAEDPQTILVRDEGHTTRSSQDNDVPAFLRTSDSDAEESPTILDVNKEALEHTQALPPSRPDAAPAVAPAQAEGSDPPTFADSVAQAPLEQTLKTPRPFPRPPRTQSGSEKRAAEARAKSGARTAAPVAAAGERFENTILVRERGPRSEASVEDDMRAVRRSGVPRLAVALFAATGVLAVAIVFIVRGSGTDGAVPAGPATPVALTSTPPLVAGGATPAAPQAPALPAPGAPAPAAQAPTAPATLVPATLVPAAPLAAEPADAAPDAAPDVAPLAVDDPPAPPPSPRGTLVRPTRVHNKRPPVAGAAPAVAVPGPAPSPGEPPAVVATPARTGHTAEWRSASVKALNQKKGCACAGEVLKTFTNVASFASTHPRVLELDAAIERCQRSCTP